MSKSYYNKKTNRLNRSYDCMMSAGTDESNPWKLLASAIVFQAAVDCQNWTPEVEKPCYNSSKRNGIQYMRKAKLREFINSDWLDLLLCWQHDIKVDAVCEELVRRFNNEAV